MADWDVSTAAASFLFDTDVGSEINCIGVDANHVLTVWQGAAADGFAQVFTVNTTTWAITTAAAQLEFDTQNDGGNDIVQVDTNHFLHLWTGGSGTNDMYAEVLTVNTTTWAVTTANSSLQVNTQNFGDDIAVIQVFDAAHYLVVFEGTSNASGMAQVLAVNTTTFAVTTAAAALEYNPFDIASPSLVGIDTNHAIVVWSGNSSDGFAQVLTVNTTTWAVTTAAASLEFDTQNFNHSEMLQVDTNHFLVVWKGGAATTDMFAQVLAVDTSTWAVSTAAASKVIDTDVGIHMSLIKIDTNHFQLFWSGASGDGFEQILEVSTTTWAVTTSDAQLEFDTQNNSFNSALKIDTTHTVNFWLGGAVTTDAFAQTFSISVPTPPASTNTNALMMMGCGA